jgi:tol-pal system protein YbgF
VLVQKPPITLYGGVSIEVGAKEFFFMNRQVQSAWTGLWVGFLLLSGCALQSDLVDVQMDLEKIQEEQAQIKKSLEGPNRQKGFLDTSQKAQSELVIRIDQLAMDLQTLQGKLEENRHTLSQLMEKVDQQGFKTNELDSRLQGLESHLTAQPESVPFPQDTGREEKPTGLPEDKKVVLPGRPPLSSLTPMEIYNLAYNDYLKGNYDLASTGFQSFLKQFPDSTLAPHAQYWLGECYYSKKDFFKAIETFDRVTKNYPKSEKAVTALLKGGLSYLEIGDRTKARAYLKKVIEEYPLSSEANLAKNKLAEIR